MYRHLHTGVGRPGILPWTGARTPARTSCSPRAAGHLVLEAAGGLPKGLDDIGGLGAIVLAIAAYLAVNSGFVALVIAVSTGRTKPIDLFGDWDDNVLETATLSLGALAGIAMTASRWHVLLVLPRCSCCIARYWCASSRRRRAPTARRACSPPPRGTTARAASCGARSTPVPRRRPHPRPRPLQGRQRCPRHLAGDEVPAAPSPGPSGRGPRARPRRPLRWRGVRRAAADLPAADAGRGELRAVAERIRRQVSRLDVATDTPDGPLTIRGLSTSIGGAAFPADASGLEPLMQAADAALYRAKRDGPTSSGSATPPPAHSLACPVVNAAAEQGGGPQVND